jgi:hypothetical protein
VELETEETSQPTEQPRQKETKRDKFSERKQPQKEGEEKKETPPPASSKKLIEKIKKLPGATAALSIPW